MASPWKFLARLVSQRRQKGPGDEQLEDRGPGGPGTGNSAKRLVRESPDEIEPPVFKSAGTVDPADGPAASHGAREQAVSHSQDTGETEGFRVDDVSRPQSPATHIIPAYGAPKVNNASETAPLKRKRRAKMDAPVFAASEAPSAVVAASDDEISLDNEIRALRGQLASKLRLQNAQLKKMLDRFER